MVVPDEYIERYGADALRCYLMFIGPFDATMAWNERALMGVKRFLDRFGAFVKENAHQRIPPARCARPLINRLGKWVGDDIPASSSTPPWPK